MTLRGGFSPSSGLMCEIVNSVGQGNFTFFRKSQRISETSGCVQIKTTIFGTNEQSSYVFTPWLQQPVLLLSCSLKLSLTSEHTILICQNPIKEFKVFSLTHYKLIVSKMFSFIEAHY